ncbi:Serine--trna ligase [Thalictrum thalictroides]|uniref:serine--tRNA ligase n=1 Tax=Thalictrum thalictroides TaxID=46969 RepID=A0A7J6W1M7_THATH|nr:Serine--trna ligase [Thalictrum thalictroides]
MINDEALELQAALVKGLRVLTIFTLYSISRFCGTRSRVSLLYSIVVSSRFVSARNMLDINLFREERGGNPELIRESLRRRFKDVGLVDEIIQLDREWRQRQFEVENLKKESNKISKEIGKLTIAKKDVSEKKTENTENKRLTAEKEVDVQKAKAELDAKLATVGNLVHDSVPESDNEENNEVVRTWGEKRMEPQLLNHVDLVERLGIADLIKGTNVAGGRGYYLKGDGVLLNQALINFGLGFLRRRNFELLQTPFFMRRDVMGECAQLAQFDEELYKVTGEGEDKYLIATAEQPLCAYHRNDWIQPTDLPLRYAGYSTCFRKEAGSHGRDTLGIFRVHQFEKVEQFCITSPDDNKSWEMLEEMITNSEEFYKELNIPYQVVSIVSGALNDAAAKKYDLEAWFPASKTYRELVSCSNCTDYQSRTLGIRYRHTTNRNDQEKKYVHLLNSTLTATERTICCILENYQKEDGVEIPAALQPFMGGLTFLPFQKIAPTKDAKGKKSKE